MLFYKICLQHSQTTWKKHISQNSRWLEVTRLVLDRDWSGHNLNIPPASCFLHHLEVDYFCNLFIIQIRCRDPLTVFPKINGCHPKFVERKWKIEETNKEQVPAVSNTTKGFLKWYKEKWQQEGGTLRKELKNEFT